MSNHILSGYRLTGKKKRLYGDANRKMYFVLSVCAMIAHFFLIPVPKENMQMFFRNSTDLPRFRKRAWPLDSSNFTSKIIVL